MAIDNPDDIEGFSKDYDYDDRDRDRSRGRGGSHGYPDCGPITQQPRPYDPISKKDAADRWKNRRRMAYMSLIAIFVATLLLYFVVPITRLEDLSNVSEWFFIVMGSVVASYVGSASWSDVVEFKSRIGRR